MKSILLAGVGGQGTVLASKLIAQCAMDKGLNARTAETIGMAQRGGCVVSHVRVGDEIHSPLIPEGQADVIIGFEPAEAVRNYKYLKQGGTVIVNSSPVKPVTDSLSNTNYDSAVMLDFLKQSVENLIIVDGNAACEKCRSSKILNIILLGTAVGSGTLEIEPQSAINAIKKLIPQKFYELNITAFMTGMESVGKEQKK